MKKCTWCGKEYSNNASICAIDGSPLVADSPSAPKPETPAETGSAAARAIPAQEENEPESKDRIANEEEPSGTEGFISLGQYDGFEAARLLRRFEAAGVEFQIEQVESPVITTRGTRRANLIEIYVHHKDQEKAQHILTEDWKV